MSRLHTKFQTALADENLNLKGWAERVNIPYATAHHFSSGKWPNNKILIALSGTQWKDANTGLELLAAHLADEIERAGRQQGEIELRVPGQSPELSADVDIINEHLEKEPDLAALFNRIAEQLRSEARHKELPSARSITPAQGHSSLAHVRTSTRPKRRRQHYPEAPPRGFARKIP